ERPPFGKLTFCGEFTRIVHELDHRHLCIVAGSAAQPDDSGVTAIAVSISRTKFIKKPLNCLDAGGTLDRILRLSLLAAETARSDLEGSVSVVEVASSLASKMYLLRPGGSLRFACERDGLLDERTKFLRLRDRRHDVIFVGID